jgi:hypothetical protein
VNAFDEQLRAGFEQLLLDAGESRPFVSLNASGAPTTTTIECIWSVGLTSEEIVAVSPNGIYFKADVLFTCRASDLPARPRPFTSVLEVPPGNKFHVVEINEDYGVYAIKLAKNVP